MWFNNGGLSETVEAYVYGFRVRTRAVILEKACRSTPTTVMVSAISSWSPRDDDDASDGGSLWVYAGSSIGIAASPVSSIHGDTSGGRLGDYMYRVDKETSTATERMTLS